MTQRATDNTAGGAPGRSRRLLPNVGAALSIVVVFIAVLAIPLGTASDLGLTPAETTAWIMTVYGLAGVLALALSLRYRQPLLLTGNVFILIFIARLGTDITWPELVGAAIVAGAVVLVLDPFGFTKRIVAWLPGPIVFGLLSGAVLPFFVDMFSALGNEPVLVGGTLAVYLLARLWLEPRIPAILPALATALLIAGLAGDLGGISVGADVPAPVFTAPVFSVRAILTVTPVMVVLISVQANAPSLVFLREQDYQPPGRVIGAVSGVGTVVGSLLGPTGVSLSLPATALAASPDAGEHSLRYWTANIAAFGSIAIAVLAGFVVEVAAEIPRTLLVVGVGLAVIGVLANALQKTTTGPLIWGPLFAFAISLSDLSLMGLGPFFWAIAGGVGISLLLERDHLKAIHDKQTG